MHGNTALNMYVRSRWCNVLAQTDQQSQKIEVKKTVNHAVIRKGMLRKRISVAVSYYQWK